VINEENRKVKHRAIEGTGDTIFDALNYCILIIGVMLVIYPLYFIVIASISDPNSIYQGKVWLLPHNVSLEGYRRIFSDKNIWTGYKNSIVYTTVGTFTNLLFTLPAAYALSRKDLDGRKTIMLMITFTMFFSGGLIPTYILVIKLGMRNTMWALIVPGAVSAWNLIVSRTFFQTTIPEELIDAAKIDGCSDIVFFTRIVLPLSHALIAIMVLFYGVGHWNGFFSALIYLSKEKLYPLQLILRSILIQNEVSQEMVTDISAVATQQKIADLIKYGIIIVASVPVMILYPFLQKYFVKGVMIGAIKG
jgi:putative aldouronate transport system permease protein